MNPESLADASPDDLRALTAVAKYLADPRFRYELNELLKKQQNVVAARERQDRVVTGLQEASLQDRHVKALQILHINERVVYSGRQFVSDEYVHLHENGLVHIENGLTDSSGLASRTVTLTQEGRALLEEKLKAPQVSPS